MDDTAHVISRAVEKAPFTLRTVYEPAAGVSRARNRGLSLAGGRIVAFTDDDCYPDSEYLLALSVCFSDNEVAFAGGRVLLFDKDDQPVTVKYQTTPMRVEPYEFVESGTLHGANMAIRREWLLRVNGFDERLGAGTYFRSGEDTDLLRRLVGGGGRGLYDPRIVIYHHHGRATVAAARKHETGYFRGRGAGMLKHIASRSTRRLYARRWFWHLRECGYRQAVHEVFYATLFYLRYGPTANRLWRHPHDSLQPEMQADP